jgi:hypothetical protein
MERRAVYPRDNIRAVYLVHNGTAIGLGVGVVTGAAFGAATYSKSNTPNLGRAGTPVVDAAIFGTLGMAAGFVLNPFFHGKAVYRSANAPGKQNSPRQPREERKSPSAAKEDDADPPVDNLPCLRDGVTLQCVQ